MSKSKILHLLSSNNFTNIENIISQSINILNNDFEFAYASPNGQISKVLRSKGINYLPIENWDLKTITNLIEAYSPDIIHAHDYEACHIASKFSKSIKVVAQIHTDSEDMKKTTLKSLSFRNVSKHFPKIVWPSEYVKNNYKYFDIKHNSEKHILISPAVDCESVIEKSNSQLEENTTQFDMLMFIDDMNIEEIKNVINILALLQGRGFTFKFGAISSNIPNAEISEYLKETGVADSFIFINKPDNYYNILSKSKILFIGKKYEDTPIYALEAGALGVPVLSVFCNGLKSIIQNEFNGFLANNEYDLANFAARMLDDRHLWLLLSTNALSTSYVQNDLEKYKTELINLYNS